MKSYLLWFGLLIGLQAQCQELSPIQRASKFMSYVSQDGGKWQAENPKYDPVDGNYIKYYLLEFDLKDSLSLGAKISGVDHRLDTILFWEVWEFYLPQQEKAILVQKSPYGSYAQGEVSFSEANIRSEKMQLFLPGGIEESHQSEHKILDKNQMISRSYSFNQEKKDWRLDAELLWKRQFEETSPLDYLIGEWTIELSWGKAMMEFAWGENQTYITCVGSNIRDGKHRQEFFSLITWDGLQEKYFISGAYTSPGDKLSQQGSMYFEEDMIYRDLVVHYSEGEYMPFLKRKAEKGGFAMPYRQRWRMLDTTTMEGTFEVNVDGQWIDPFSKNSEKKKERWIKTK